MKKTQHVGVVGIAICLVVACAPVPQESPAATIPLQAATAEGGVVPPVHLRLGTLKYLSNGPIFIAKDAGFFEEQGLDVEFVDFGYIDRDMLAALLDGQLDVAATTFNAGILNAIAKGGEVKAVADKSHADPESCPTEAWLANTALVASGELDDPSTGLRGKTVVTFIGTTYEYATDLLLANAGLTQQDVEITTIADATARIEAIRNGSVDVANEAEPWITRSGNEGASKLWMPLSDVVPNLSVAAVVYGPGILSENREAGVRFMAAYLKGVEAFKAEKSDENIAIIAKYTGLAPDDIRNSCWNSISSDGTIDLDQLQNFVDWAGTKGYLEAPLVLEQIWDPEFLELVKSR